MIVDYYLVKKGDVLVRDLYNPNPDGRYWYANGVNLRAVAALVPAGLLAVGAILAPGDTGISNFSFFIGAGSAALLYAWIERKTVLTPRPA